MAELPPFHKSQRIEVVTIFFFDWNEILGAMGQ